MNLKKLIVLLVVAFVLFFLISQPQSSADTVQNVLTWLKDAAQSIITFIQSLFS